MSRLAAILAVLMSAAALGAQAQPPFGLPAPTGKSPIGTTRWVVTDTSRQETFASGQPRQVEVIAWYPAVASVGPTAPYLRDGMEEVLAGEQKWDGVTVAQLRKP